MSDGNIEYEKCRNCNYKFVEDFTSSCCPVCSTSRDRYSNFSKQTGMEREDVKWLLVPFMYGSTQ